MGAARAKEQQAVQERGDALQAAAAARAAVAELQQQLGAAKQSIAGLQTHASEQDDGARASVTVWDPNGLVMHPR